jgi:hypothetical protein
MVSQIRSSVFRYSRLDGGATPGESISSSSSLVRLLPLLLGPAPRFAEAIFARSGELKTVNTSSGVVIDS